MRKLPIVIASICALALQGCFTGVESTPKISYADVKKEKIPSTPEQKFLADIVPEPPAQWKPGKKFYVTDPKIAIAFSWTTDLSPLVGKEIAFKSMYPVTSVAGEEVTEIEFATPSGRSICYRDNTPFASLAERQSLTVPFTIEQSLVEAARQRLAGNKYYIVTPLWYTPDGSKADNGLRHVPVDITGVEPGNDVYPIRVIFTDSDGKPHSVYMTVGSQRSATRNFHTLFAFDNPRDKHPRISDDVWDLIIHSKVREGMTREECRLALGSPQTIGQRPTTAGMVEFWQYTDGAYLIFDEGYLSSFRK